MSRCAGGGNWMEEKKWKLTEKPTTLLFMSPPSFECGWVRRTAIFLCVNCSSWALPSTASSTTLEDTGMLTRVTDIYSNYASPCLGLPSLCHATNTMSFTGEQHQRVSERKSWRPSPHLPCASSKFLGVRRQHLWSFQCSERKITTSWSKSCS